MRHYHLCMLLAERLAVCLQSCWWWRLVRGNPMFRSKNENLQNIRKPPSIWVALMMVFDGSGDDRTVMTTMAMNKKSLHAWITQRFDSVKFFWKEVIEWWHQVVCKEAIQKVWCFRTAPPGLHVGTMDEVDRTKTVAVFMTDVADKNKQSNKNAKRWVKCSVNPKNASSVKP